MKIVSLVENTSNTDCKAKHGLSLYIETPNHKLLFDLGPDDTFLKNADLCGVDVSAVDTVVISHGHYDHGGGLGAFLERNHTARVYLQRGAFEPHFNKTGLLRLPIGLDAKLENRPQVQLLDGDTEIDGELSVFTVGDTSKCHSPMNDVLLDQNGKDKFAHEQNLLIRAASVVLITGCGHTGIVNIMEKAKQYRPAVCVGGFHLFNPALRKTAPAPLLDEIGEVLKGFCDTTFYTCHCTGPKAFQYLSKKAENVRYLACGDVLTV